MKRIPVRRLKDITILLDEIKDEIDELESIISPKRQLDAAKELVEYIELHFLQGGP